MAETNNSSTNFSTTGWRIRAKLAVRPPHKIGLFKPGTHEVEDLIDCPDHHPSINEALRIIRNTPFIPYNEQTGEGDLRYLQLTTSRQTSSVQLVLVANGSGKCHELAQKLWETHPFHSIWINVQEGSTNTIFGPTWKHLFGPEYLEENLLGHPIFLHPACFIQANLTLFETILTDIKNLVLPQKKILELYAGFGAISLTLADKCLSSTLIENNPYAERSFRKCNPPKHLHFLTDKAEKHTELLEEVLIVDPPRKGLDSELLEAILHSSLEQILYLSCNPKTLERDIEILKKGGWSIESETTYDLFPNTPHVETLVSLKK